MGERTASWAFVDEAVIEVRSGKGGNGCIAFRREKYIPLGGPNGGDGGKGGDVVFCVKRNMRTLSRLRSRVVFKAQNGTDGSSWNRAGRDGEDVIINVPPGTTLEDEQTGEIIKDFTNAAEGETFTFLAGGKGGWGNIHFKSSVNQAPRKANPGEAGQVRRVRVQLSIMADLGLVGFPNAGKSSLLASFTNARPKIAPYPFTTKVPYLGVLRVDDEHDIILADIPGIIEGASAGVGLGLGFLKHISRTKALVFIIDCADASCFTAYKTLKNELKTYGAGLDEKKRIVLCNKIDEEGALERARDVIKAIHQEEKDTVALPVSVLRGTNMRGVCEAVIKIARDANEDGVASGEVGGAGGKARGTGGSTFLSTRSIDESMQVQYPGEDNSEWGY